MPDWMTRLWSDKPSTLDGSGSSDVDGDLLTYQWSIAELPSGSNTTLADSATVMPSFEIDRPGTYTLQLIVNDGTVDSDPDTVNFHHHQLTPGGRCRIG